MLVITIENPLATAAGLVGNILSFLVVLAPMPTFYKIYKKKSTEEFGSVPYMVALFSAMMWIYYGALTMDYLLLTINVGASLIETAYLVLFLIYAPAKPRAFTLKLVSLLNVGGYGSVVLFTMLFLRGGRRTNIAGWICASFAFSCFVAPLSIIKQVIRTKSVEYMPISLSFFLTVSAIAWLGYGLLLGDMHVAVPNVVGFLFGIAQIIIYLIYKNAKKDETKTKLGNQDAEAMAAAVTSGSDIELPEKLSTPLAEV